MGPLREGIAVHDRSSLNMSTDRHPKKSVVFTPGIIQTCSDLEKTKNEDGMGTIPPQKGGARQDEHAGQLWDPRTTNASGSLGGDLNLIGNLNLITWGSKRPRVHDQNTIYHNLGVLGEHSNPGEVANISRKVSGEMIEGSIRRAPSPKRRKMALAAQSCNGNCPKAGWTIAQYCERCHA